MRENNAIRLYSNRLEVEISQPGAAYSGTRFDWSSFVTQVTLDKKHTYCIPESLVPGQGSGGIGLCNEFGIDAPIGYDEAKPGDLFPKLGIGLLARLDKPDYSFWYPHQIAELFPVEISQSDHSVTFIVQPIDCRGFSVRLTKTLSVSEARLEVKYHLENTGSRQLNTNEYNHNFVAIDNQPMGPDYVLRMPFQIGLEKLSEEQIRSAAAALRIEGNEIRLRETPKNPFYCRPLGFSRTDQPQWELVHMPSGAGLREIDDFTPIRIAIWGTTHVISAEIFIDIDLQPGAAMSWTRSYEFF
jgi:hypothetical protein